MVMRPLRGQHLTGRCLRELSDDNNPIRGACRNGWIIRSEIGDGTESAEM